MKTKTWLAVIIGIMVLMCGSVVCQAAAKHYTVNKKTKTITVKVSKGDDIADRVNEAITYAGKVGSKKNIYTVKVPKGSYTLKKTIHVYGNIILDTTGCTITYKKSDGNMLMLGDTKVNEKKSKMSGYGSYQNITVKGGTWKGYKKNSSSLFRMAHSKNVTLEKVTFSGGGCAHQVEVAAIDGFTVKNCTFRDMPGNGTSEKQEALQLDVPCSKYVFDGVVLDGTPMKNVTITGCTFKNVPRGLGTHSMLVGYYHDNITITNNTFQNVAGECIVALNYTNCTISGNTIKKCGAGILFQTFKPDVKAVYNTIYNGKQKAKGKIVTDTNSVITDNKITLKKSKDADESVAIKVYGYNLTKAKKATGIGSSDTIPKGNYYAGNVAVTDNTITTCGHGIHLLDAYDCTVAGNQITCTATTQKFDGIFVEFKSKRATIQKNTIKKSSRYGIFLKDQSTAKSITGNKITSSKDYAIGLYDSSACTGKISNNTLTNVKTTAIFVNLKSSAKEISGNKITSPGEKGISVYNGSSVAGSISNNTITGSGDNGIFIGLKSSVTDITGNTVTKAAGRGIFVYNNSKVKGKISDNTVTGAKKGGIAVSGEKTDFTTNNTIR